MSSHQEFEPVHVVEAKAGAPGIADLAATTRDVLYVLISLNDRGNPQVGPTLTAITAEMSKFYDRKAITEESVAYQLRLLVNQRLIVTDGDPLHPEGDDRYQPTIDARDLAELHLVRLGRLWEETIPWEDHKIVIESREIDGAEVEP